MKAELSLHIRAVLPEPLLFTHMIYIMANHSELSSHNNQYRNNGPMCRKSRFLSLKYQMFIEKIVIFAQTFKQVFELIYSLTKVTKIRNFLYFSCIKLTN